MRIALALLVALSSWQGGEAFRSPSRFNLARRVIFQREMLPELLLAAGMDYSAEIESATVGTEVYTPIFQAGLSLFASGILAAFVAAFIISKSDSWEELGNEFERGKEKQLIFSEMPDTVNKQSRTEEKTSAEGPLANEQDLKGLDV